MFGLGKKKRQEQQYPVLLKIVSGVVATTARGAVTDLVIEVDFGNAPPTTIPFTYSPDDPSPLTPQIALWLGARPKFTLGREDRPVTVAEVKLEAARRVRQIVSRWKVERAATGGKPISATDQKAAQAVRDASNRIEQMNPIPADFTDDRHWT